ncbi:MAG: dienelactone hydrolase family protein [Clostridia bacterium]|nr:dienelactone hydrolase family protein [Clostridia bacterium]
MIRTEHWESHWEFPFVKYASQDSCEKLPLILQLHGAGERGDGGEDLSRVEIHGFARLLQSQDYPCILAMPQCPKDSFWAARVESILRFLDQLKQQFPIDEDRVYLTGLSMGGYGTWYTAMASPSSFAAIAPVCGGGMAWNAQVLRMPVWAFHGTADETVSPRNTEEMVQRLRELNYDVTYSRLEGVGHNAWVQAYQAPLLEWLLEKRRGLD